MHALLLVSIFRSTFCFNICQMDQLRIFLSGDVMTGRGIDQILPYPSTPTLHEGWVHDARDYVRLAEKKCGPLPRAVSFGYIWGDALAQLEQAQLDFRFINLETSITTSDRWLAKGINYRMHPHNIPCLQAAGIHGCTLANNHILDWGQAGLIETLEALKTAGIKTTGAGRNAVESATPIVLTKGDSRLLFFSVGTFDSGIAENWCATSTRPGVNFIPDLSQKSIGQVRKMIDEYRKPGDVVILSIHWGLNWSFSIPEDQRSFARTLLAEGIADLIHGHSSHHVKAIEVFQGKLILYGCGDLLTDYEGIGGYQEFRADLSLLYFVTLGAYDGKLLQLEMVPMRTERFRLALANADEAQWLAGVLNREGERFQTSVSLNERRHLTLNWQT